VQHKKRDVKGRLVLIHCPECEGFWLNPHELLAFAERPESMQQLVDVVVAEVDGVLAGFKQPADLGDLLPLPKLHVGATQLRNDLVHRVSVLLHLKESFPGSQPG
jgi:hypothetical protein